MAKKTLKLKCISTNSNEKTSAVRFADEVDPITSKEPGKPPVRVAKTVLQINFTTVDGAKDYTAGKMYSVTIEG